MTGAAIVTAGGGHAWETALVAEISRGGGPFTVVQRCVDIADVIAVASTGQIVAAVVAADLRRLDSETVFELAAFGVAVVGVHRAADERLPVALERIGVVSSVPDDVTPAGLIAALRAATETDRPAVRAEVVGADPVRAIPTDRSGTSVDRPGAPAASDATDPVRLVQAPGDAAGGVVSDAGGVLVGAGDGAADAAGGGRALTESPAADQAAGDAPRRRLLRPGSRRSAHRAGRSRADAARSVAAAQGAGTVGHAGAARGVGAAPGVIGRRDAEGPARRGRVVAVWGPTGAPGRSTVAMGLADRLVAGGSTTVLIDADVYGGVLANAFGLLDESAGLAGACRLASGGRLYGDEFARLCWRVRDGLTLLTGIARADRWPEVRPSAIPMVLDRARERAETVVVDCSSVVETDEEITFDTLAPRRNGATLAVLRAADVVIAVGSADPPGMERLARGLAEVGDSVADVEPRIVFNRVRPSAASRQELRDASRRYCGRDPVAYLPEDRPSVDLAWRRGVTLSVAAAKSPLVGAFDELAATVLDAPQR